MAVIFLCAQGQKYRAFNDVTEFFSCMGDVFSGGRKGGKPDENRFHTIFLRIRDQPAFYRTVRRFLDVICFAENDFFVFFVFKKFAETASQGG